jgi:hypothetical protein
MKIFILAGAIVMFILVAPFITIWSLNTLFALGIPYTPWTWCAMIWAQAVLVAVRSNS